MECAACGHEAIESIRLADLAGWDESALCPVCQAAAAAYRRVIRQAPGIHGGAKGDVRSAVSRKSGLKVRFVRSGERDAMMQKQAKNHDADQVAACKDNAKSGRFEGF